MKTEGLISKTASVDELNTENIPAVTTNEEVAATVGAGKWSKHSQRQQVPCTCGIRLPSSLTEKGAIVQTVYVL